MTQETAKQFLSEAMTAVTNVAPLPTIAAYAAVAVVAVAALYWVRSRLRARSLARLALAGSDPGRGGGARFYDVLTNVDQYLESDFGRRHWNGVIGVWQRLFTGGKLGLAVLASIVLTMASFYTTWNGMTYFLGGSMVALLAALAIQIILFIASWLIAESSAGKLSVRMRRKSPLLSPFDKERAEALIARSRLWAPSLFLMSLFVSVFFSYDALYDKVYQPKEQLLNNLKVARSTVSAVYSDVRAKIEKNRKETIAALAEGADWKRWSVDLDKILAVGESSRALIQESRDKQLATLQTKLATLRDTLEKKQSEAADLDGKIKVSSRGGSSSAQEFADLKARVQQLTQSTADMQSDIDAATKARDDIKANRDAEDTAGGRNPNGTRRNQGRGPVWHQLDRDLVDANTRLAAKKASLQAAQSDLAKAKRDLESATSRSGELKAQLDARHADIESLKSQIAEADLQYNELTNTGGLLAGPDARGSDARRPVLGDAAASNDVVKSIRDSEQAFLGNGSPVAFERMFAGCSELTAVLKKNDVTAPRLNGLSCDASSIAPQVDRLRAIDAAAKKVNAECVVDDGFTKAQAVSELTARGASCLSLSALPETQIASDRAEIDRVTQENSPETTHFVRAYSTLRRMDPLAVLALAIAAIIDLLVLAAAMLGARANVTPLSDVFLSGRDHEENDIAEHVDTRIFTGDSSDMINKKLVLAGARPIPGMEPEDEPYPFAFSLNDVPPEYCGNVRSLLYYWISRHLVKVDPKEPSLYLLQQPLIRHLTYAIGRYERNMKQKREQREGRRLIFSPGARAGDDRGGFHPQPPRFSDTPVDNPIPANPFAASGGRRGPRPIS